MKQLKYLWMVVVLFASPVLAQTTYYVSPSGDDMNPGTFELPFRTIPRAVTAAVAGDTIYIRGGTHPYSTTISISKQGTNTNRFYLFAYPGERPLLDFSSMPIADNLRGINLSGRYWHVKGLDIYKAGDNGMLLRGQYNIIENCAFFENHDTGLQLSNGAAYNQIINCDSYNNADPSQGNADGFAVKLDVGTGNYLYGCRAWQNSDDGYDGYLRGADNVTTVLENCWIFRNGYLSNGQPSVGNGNGIKMGGGDNGNADSLKHRITMIRCLVFDNRVKGFDQNNNRGSMTILHGSAFRNGTNYSVSGAIAAGETLRIVNSLALGSVGSIAGFAIQQTNSWMPPFMVTTADFASTDTAGVRGPRNADGSLPILPFMRLAQGSDLIDAGTNIGLPYLGNGPDLGWAEYEGPTNATGEPSRPAAFRLDQNYPNPFNPATRIPFSVRSSGGSASLTTGLVSLKVFDVLGREVATLVNERLQPGRYEVTFDASNLAGGVYFYKLQSGGLKETKRMMLVK